VFLRVDFFCFLCFFCFLVLPPLFREEGLFGVANDEVLGAENEDVLGVVNEEVLGVVNEEVLGKENEEVFGAENAEVGVEADDEKREELGVEAELFGEKNEDLEGALS
jgi:hypothetical protein